MYDPGLKRLALLTLCGIFAFISTISINKSALLRSGKTDSTHVISKRIPLKCGEKLKDAGKSILVTGGAGFIGMHTAIKLKQQGYEVIVIDNLNRYYSRNLKNDRVKLLQEANVKFIKGDVCDVKLLEEVFEQHSIDRVVHLAAQAGVRYSLEDPYSYTKNNVDCFVSVLEAIVKSNLHDKPFVYASSSSVYGFIDENIPSAEDKQDVDHPASLYAATKRADELIAHTYNHLYKVPSVGIRFFTVYGAYGRPDMSPMIFADKIMNGDNIKLSNFGNSIRDFTHVSDIVEGIIASLEYDTDQPEVLNLGGNNPIKLTKFLKIIENGLGKKAMVEKVPLQQGDVPFTSANIEKAQCLLGWTPKVSIENGMGSFLKWFLEENGSKYMSNVNTISTNTHPMTVQQTHKAKKLYTHDKFVTTQPEYKIGKPFEPDSLYHVEISDSSENILPPGIKKHSYMIDKSKKYDLCTIGAGLSGTVFAERAANYLSQKVLVIDSRPHIAGNCFDYIDQKTGILRNQYGSHLFHTKMGHVWDYVTSNPKAPRWKRWYHAKFGVVNGDFVPIPVNIQTVNRLLNTDIKTADEMNEWLKTVQIPCPEETGCENAEQMAKSRVGEELYKAIFEGYTIKQWGRDPKELNASVTARIPVVPSWDPRYFGDKWQSLPSKGYTEWFAAMLDHENIDVVLNTDFFAHRSHLEQACEKIVYTGPIDRYFEQSGMEKLEYRSIIFTEERHMNHPGYILPTPVLNYPGLETNYTRAVEYKHYLHRASNHTIVVKEVSSSDGDPYYPVPTKRNQELYSKYQALASKLEEEGNIQFVGRLANYKYYNMDQAIDNALNLFYKSVPNPAPRSSKAIDNALNLFYKSVPNPLTQSPSNESIMEVQMKGGATTRHAARNTLLYIVSSSNEYQLQKIREMAQAFGQDFVVIWDNQVLKSCPKDFAKEARCIDQWQWADEKRGLTRETCCGWQKAIAWATDNRKSSDYFWFMEEDVHYTNVSLLKDLLNNTNDKYDDTADLLNHHWPEIAERWPHAWKSKKSMARRNGWGWNFWKENTQLHNMMNLFRTSELFLTRLEEDFHSNQNTWDFFETYFLAVADFYKLKISSWKSNNHNMRFKLCWTEFATPGIYHPAKFRDGKFIECQSERQRLRDA